MNYKVISETNIGVVVQHDDISTACKMCKFTTAQCLIRDDIDCGEDGRYLTTEEENEYHKTKQLCR